MDQYFEQSSLLLSSSPVVEPCGSEAMYGRKPRRLCDFPLKSSPPDLCATFTTLRKVDSEEHGLGTHHLWSRGWSREGCAPLRIRLSAGQVHPTYILREEPGKDKVSGYFGRHGRVIEHMINAWSSQLNLSNPF